MGCLERYHRCLGSLSLHPAVIDVVHVQWAMDLWPFEPSSVVPWYAWRMLVIVAKA